MRVIGITGGIGSGKSTVSAMLSRLGAEVIDADAIAREVVQKGSKALNELAEYFGTGILGGNGELNRSKLASIVFTDPEKLMSLNRISHKYVVEKIIENINRIKEENRADTIVIDAPIPVEHGFIDVSDEIWVVTAHPEIRVKRVMARSALSYEEALSRVNSQKSDEDYIRIASRMICNNGDIKELEDAVARLFNQKNQGGIIEES